MTPPSLPRRLARPHSPGENGRGWGGSVSPECVKIPSFICESEAVLNANRSHGGFYFILFQSKPETFKGYKVFMCDGNCADFFSLQTTTKFGTEMRTSLAPPGGLGGGGRRSDSRFLPGSLQDQQLLLASPCWWNGGT